MTDKELTEEEFIANHAYEIDMAMFRRFGYYSPSQLEYGKIAFEAWLRSFTFSHPK